MLIFTLFFCSKPMYIFLLGVGKMIKKSLVHLLCDKIKSPEIRTTNNKEKQFWSIKRTFIVVIHKFLLQTVNQCPGYGLELDYFRKERQSPMSDFYTETRIQGILQASDYDSIDNFLPFLGALVDASYGNTKSAKVVKTFTWYGYGQFCVQRRKRAVSE